VFEVTLDILAYDIQLAHVLGTTLARIHNQIWQIWVICLDMVN